MSQVRVIRVWRVTLLMEANLCVCSSDTGEATLRILGVASEDDGVYTCIASNELGSVTSSASLRVLGKRRDTHIPQFELRGASVNINSAFFVPAVSTDGIRVSWKDNFDSHYTEVVELGR